MAILRQLRTKPDFFITFTANANWKEVKDAMALHNVPMSCRDDIIVRVFNAKLKHLMNDLKKKNALGLITFFPEKQLSFINFYSFIQR